MNPQHTRLEFEWDGEKDLQNQQKHNVVFRDARLAFADPNRIIYEDVDHSTKLEVRYFWVGMVDDKVMAVRFTLSDRRVQLIGAGYCRKERMLYEERNG